MGVKHSKNELYENDSGITIIIWISCPSFSQTWMRRWLRFHIGCFQSRPTCISLWYYSEPPGLEIACLTFATSLAALLVCVVLESIRANTAINRYLFNLGIADIGVLLVVFPIAVLTVKTYFLLGKGICLYVYPIIDTFYGALINLVSDFRKIYQFGKGVEVYRSRSLMSM